MTASALDTLKSRGPTFRARDARAAGLHWRDLYALRDAGEVIELSRGLFRFADAEGVTGIDLLTVSRRAPDGMICLVSALAHWDLTDEIPAAVDLAVPRGSSRPAINYPPTRVHLFDPRTFPARTDSGRPWGGRGHRYLALGTDDRGRLPAPESDRDRPGLRRIAWLPLSAGIEPGGVDAASATTPRRRPPAPGDRSVAVMRRPTRSTVAGRTYLAIQGLARAPANRRMSS